MKASMSILLLSIVYVLILNLGCKKNISTECNGARRPSGEFVTKELVGDTAFIADTIFHDNYVQFQALDKYESVTWKIGSDPRLWSDSSFSLSFINDLGTIPVNFSGMKTPDTRCFPDDNGTYISSERLTLVEQVDKSTLTLSPLIGSYDGYFTDDPTDIFRVQLEYFDSTKYDISVTGTKNFYWLSNLPKGFSSSLGLPYPELNKGYSLEMGYKCFVFGSGSSMVQGKGWLSHDTLYVNYGSTLAGRRKFIGKKI
jgi:hypothetical protein